MKNARLKHKWDLTPREAIEFQKKLAKEIIQNRPINNVSSIAGIDVGFTTENAIAAAIVLDFQTMERIDQAVAVLPISFPYVPGLLSFREGPVVLKAIKELKIVPDVIMMDGQGIAHPRRLGIASHIGLILGMPTIGCGKSRLCGHHEEPNNRRGSQVPLIDKDEIIGSVLRTRTGVRPVYVSVGHLINLLSCIDIVLKCCPKFRLPEPLRQAHHLATTAK